MPTIITASMARDDASKWPVLATCWLAATISLVGAWGFTVDDALISTKVAHNLARGFGYRFNPAGDVVDCVTPLGWAPLLMPLAFDTSWTTLLAARWLGVACHFATATVLGWAWIRARVGFWQSLPTACVVAACLPLGAWASSGMETPLVTLLATMSLLGGRLGFISASLAAALRPELLPWAFCLAMASPHPTPRRRALGVLMAMSGALAVALLRAWLFGQPAPLAVLAKPSDFEHGLRYGIGGTVLCGVPLLLLGARAFARITPTARAHSVAIVAHVGAVTVAGGDWMALFRLFVPVLPCCAWVAPQLLAVEPRWWARGKLALAAAACALLIGGKLTSARGVLESRRTLLLESSDLLVGRTVGTLDVGWVSAADPFEVVDFAGVTDRRIASLPGGHTSKKLPKDLLLRRNVDTLVLLLAAASEQPWEPPGGTWRSLRFSRQVEQRVTQLDGAERFVPIRTVPLRGSDQAYLILSRLSERVATR